MRELHGGRILNRVPSRDQHLDWTHEHFEAAFGSGAAHPPNVDLRDPRWPVNDQGDTGSCVGWATANGVLRPLLHHAGRLDISVPVSPRFIWMAAKETDAFRSQATTFIEDEGTSIKAACRIATKFGAVPEALLPFGGGLFQGTTEEFYAAASRLRASSYYNLGRASKDTWRSWLWNRGPILIGMDVDATWDDAGPAALDVFQPQTIRGGHAVAIVGYAPQTFLVRNSWGTNWGDHGFATVTDRYASSAFTEAYGIVP
jgi:hypothetical protein